MAGERLTPDDRKHPDDAETTATIPPTTSATWTGSDEKNPGSKSGDRMAASGSRAREGVGVPTCPPVLRPGHDQHPALDVDDLYGWPYSRLSVSVVTTSSGCRGGPTIGQIDDTVHHRQQRVHVVRRQQDRDLLFGAIRPRRSTTSRPLGCQGSPGVRPTAAASGRR